MRFAIIAAAFLSLASSVLAGDDVSTEFINPGGGHKFECHKFSKVSWKKFSFEKKFIAFVMKDENGMELARKVVEPSRGEVEFVAPEPKPKDKKVTMFLVDTQTNVVFAQGETVTIDCPTHNGGGKVKENGNMRGDGNEFGNNAPWN